MDTLKIGVIRVYRGAKSIYSILSRNRIHDNMIRCSYFKKNTVSTMEEVGGACTGHDGMGATAVAWERKSKDQNKNQCNGPGENEAVSKIFSGRT